MSRRLAGGWAAAMTATVGVATSPFVSYDRVTLNYHTPTWCAVVVCAVYCYWLSHEQSRLRLVAAGVLVALLAGISLTDSLFAFAGLVPLAVAGAFLIRSAPSAALRLQGVLAIAVAGLAIPPRLADRDRRVTFRHSRLPARAAPISPPETSS